MLGAPPGGIRLGFSFEIFLKEISSPYLNPSLANFNTLMWSKPAFACIFLEVFLASKSTQRKDHFWRISLEKPIYRPETVCSSVKSKQLKCATINEKYSHQHTIAKKPSGLTEE